MFISKKIIFITLTVLVIVIAAIYFISKPKEPTDFSGKESYLAVGSMIYTNPDDLRKSIKEDSDVYTYYSSVKVGVGIKVKVTNKLTDTDYYRVEKIEDEYSLTPYDDFFVHESSLITLVD